MDNKELEVLKLHVLGATVQYLSPFDDFISFKNDFELSQGFIDNMTPNACYWFVLLLCRVVSVHFGLPWCVG